MSSQTKIVVLKRRELIYTGIFAAFGVLLIILAFWMFSGQSSKSDNNTSPNHNTNRNIGANTDNSSGSDNGLRYNSDTAHSFGLSENSISSPDTELNLTPGCYTSTIQLGTQTLEVWLCVDSNHINSAGFTSLDESVATMYPLMESTMTDICRQLQENQSFDITCSEDTKYTTQTIVNALNEAYIKALPEE